MVPETLRHRVQNGYPQHFRAVRAAFNPPIIALNELTALPVGAAEASKDAMMRPTETDTRPDQHDPRRSRRWQNATAKLQYTPMPQAMRETAKRRGWATLDTSTDAIERTIAAELVLRAWFDRSLERAIHNGYWRKHPAYEEYVTMIALRRYFPLDVVDDLERLTGPYSPGEIEPNDCYWRGLPRRPK